MHDAMNAVPNIGSHESGVQLFWNEVVEKLDSPPLADRSIISHCMLFRGDSRFEAKLSVV